MEFDIKQIKSNINRAQSQSYFCMRTNEHLGVGVFHYRIRCHGYPMNAHKSN